MLARKTRKTVRLIWIFISLLAILGMLSFTLLPFFQSF